MAVHLQPAFIYFAIFTLCEVCGNGRKYVRFSWGRITGFEVTHNGVNGTRYIDIELDNLIRVEVKSWSKMYPATFIKQFVEKDLANVSNLKNMR
ncbi:hypothetical protein [Williamwhitmania taraxaci]|uniref:Uncharacterized protein n=1 Tax=Williamwhitmania taraxaci TaxID=1640674 RepID=A0A1G6SKF5_9BACT|nr:hypothetical protein [Williamwhitmania taraxaci]SDD17359.1 hypothetical protein SAMN05216323_10964 [Williamwhitmania taraxaci]